MELTGLDRHPQFNPHEGLITGERRQWYLTVKDAFLGSAGDEEKINFDHMGYRQLHHAKWFERVFLVLAGGALYGAFELSLHQVDDNGLIPLQVQLPESVRLLLISAFQVWHLDIFLLFDPVEIFVEQVEQLGQEFLRVVLLVSLEHHAVRAETLFEVAWVQVVEDLVFVPHLIEEVGESCDYFSLGP